MCTQTHTQYSCHHTSVTPTTKCANRVLPSLPDGCVEDSCPAIEHVHVVRNSAVCAACNDSRTLEYELDGDLVAKDGWADSRRVRVPRVEWSGRTSF